MKLRVLLDTNLIVSYLINANSTPGAAVTFSLLECTILASDETLDELREVLSRPKLQRYFSQTVRESFLSEFAAQMELIKVTERVRICRDSKDDKFLEAAKAGNADYVVTGDSDLLELKSFLSTQIVTPAKFLASV